MEGITVLDLARVLVGPWCTMTLADLGAETWKVETLFPRADGGLGRYTFAARKLFARGILRR